MTKFRLIAMLVLPSLGVLSGILKAKDANDSGVDDETALAIDHLIGRLTIYLAAGEPAV